MTCKEKNPKDRILRFDQLLEHIEIYSTCQTYFDQYLTIENIYVDQKL